MKILRFDCVGGASGDMILNALIQLCQEQGISIDAVEEPLHALIPDHFHLRRSEKSSHGMSGTMLDVDIHEHHHEHHGHHEHEHGHSHEHHHRSFADIRAMIEQSGLPENVKKNAVNVFSVLAQAEGFVHGRPADEVHFHEVGATDSIIDMVGACLAYDLLKVDGISVSPLPIGSGTVTCAHGVYPVPAPAVAYLLKEYRLPVSLDNEDGEMLTPTAAALFAAWPKAEASGNAVITTSVHSLGHREMVSRPNLLRARILETSDATSAFLEETLVQLECNLDDATGEQLASAMAAVFAAGAKDVWFTPVTMKKQRPGILFGVLCDESHRAKILETVFRHTGTFGVRETAVRRYSLARRWETVETKYGSVRVKIGSMGDTTIRTAPEFDDCQAAAKEHGVPVSEVMAEAVRVYQK